MNIPTAFLIFFISNLILAHCENILIIQSYGYYSHTKVQHSLFLDLLQHGHNLTIFTPRIMDFSGYENITQYHFKEHYLDSNDSTIDEILKFIIINGGWFFLNNLAYVYQVLKTDMKMLEFKKLFLEPENHKFDLIMLETDLYICEILAEIYDCPVVKFSACEMVIFQHEMIGNLVHPSIHTSIFMLPRIHGNLSFFDRILSFLLYILKYFYSFVLEFFVNDILQDSLPSELRYPRGYKISYKRLQMRFTFLNLMTESIRPIIPSYHQIGFYHIEPPKSLDIELENFINTSINGVILLSIGSELSLTEIHQQIFLNAFKKLQFDIIWKVDPEKVKKFEIPKNVLTSNWLPVSDILGHLNVKALITHGGARTIEEAIDREIPMIFIPMVCDQQFNVKFLTKKGVGISLDINEISEKSVINAADEIMKYIYKKNVRKYKEYVYDQMMTSHEIARENIKVLLKHKDVYSYQQYEGRRIGFITRYFIDIYLILSLFIFIFYYLRKFLGNL
ncbi:unnamed protein product [Chironomus riparius]|uniref:Glucuronosyltransferase n=1 Tax=Chironomus riparius TaxID=315576 RepID=A0A9N9S881_9DIPT|nr:unnamed protein product [Chironomus riparius]